MTAGEFTPVELADGGRRRHRVVRHRGAAAAAPALAGRAAPRDRAGAADRAGRVPAPLAAGRRVGARRRGGRRRAGAAAGRGDPGLGLGAAGAARPGWPTTPRPTWTSCARPARWSGPAPGSMPGGDGWVVVRLGRVGARCCCRRPTRTFAAGRGARRLLRDALDGGQALFFRQLAEQASTASRGRRAGRAVGPGLGRAGLQRHARPGAGAAVRRRRAPSRGPRRPASRYRTPGPAAGEPAQPGLAGRRPLRAADRGRPLVPAARPGPQPDPSGHRAGRGAAGAARRASPGAR